MNRFKWLSIILIIILFIGCQAKRQFEWPKVQRKEQFVQHKYFALVYDDSHELAKWTAYSLTSKETYPYVERSYNYRQDPKVSTFTPTYDDYKKTGFDRGHLIPARDMMFNELAQVEVNYMSNITPQEPGFNRGIWRVLERNVRRWANQYDSVMVVTGPILTDSLAKIGDMTKFSVPESYFKTVMVFNDTIKSGIAFHIPNQKAKNSDIFQYAITIDSLEIITEMDFYPQIPRKLQYIEDTVIFEHWRK
jgi:endonuclease G